MNTVNKLASFNFLDGSEVLYSDCDYIELIYDAKAGFHIIRWKLKTFSQRYSTPYDVGMIIVKRERSLV